MMHRPLIPLLISYLTGLLVGNYFHLPTGPTLIVTAALLFVLLFTILLERKHASAVFLPAIFILIGCLFINPYIHPQLPNNHVSNFLKNDYLNVQGTLYNPPKLLEDRSRLYVKAERIYVNGGYTEVTGRILLTIGETGTHLKYGDRVRFICRLRRPRNFHNPGSFDYSRYLARQGILVTGYVKSNKDIARMGEGYGNSFRKIIEDLREEIRAFIDGRPELRNRHLVKALLLGEKGEVSQRTKENFTSAGVAHILAISGLHIGFIALIAFICARGALRLSQRLMLALDINKVAAILTICPVLFYAFIAGFGTSTFRATIMIITFLLAIIIDRQRDLYNTMALAAFIITLISPPSIFHVSFQLSFVSVLAIVYLVPRFVHYLSLIPGLPANPVPPAAKNIGKYIGLLALVSMAATLGTGPIVAYNFNRVALLGFLSNIVIVPVVGFIVVPLSLLVGLTIFISPPLASLLLGLDSIVIDYVVYAVGSFSRLPGISFWITTPTILEIILFYIFLIFLFNIGKLKWTGYVAVTLLALIASDYSYWYYVKNLNKTLRVTFLDVGQGDSAVIEFPKGKRMVIDGGGFYNDSFDTGRNILAPFLWKEKIKRVDYLVLSHPHPDHLNGLRFIAGNFGVKEIWTNGQGTNQKPYHELMEIIEQKGLKETEMNILTPPGNINGVRVDVFSPPNQMLGHQKIGFHSSLNNNSLVVKLTFKEVRFLFTGDIEKETETRLIELGELLESTVIKVPHHGSLTSSTKGFLNLVRPSHAVFSAGYKNRFKLPRKKVIDRYRDLGCETYRTDRDGAVTMVTDGESFSVKKFRTGQLEELH